MRILIVDDDQPIRKWICTCILKAFPGDTDIVEAAGGAQALKLYGEVLPDFLMTDICMPGMDGLELAKEIRERYHDANIIILTSYRDFDYARRAVSFGVKEYILKTEVSPTRIREALESLQSSTAVRATEIDTRHIRRNALLKDFIGNTADLPEVNASMLETYGIRLADAPYVALAVRSGGCKPKLGERPLATAYETLSNINWCITENNCYVMIANIRQGRTPGEEGKICREYVSRSVDDDGTIIGFGGVHTGLRELAPSIRSAINNVTKRFYAPERTYFEREYVCTEEDRTLVDLAFGTVDEHIVRREVPELSQSIRALFDTLARTQPPDVDKVQRRIRNMLRRYCMLLLAPEHTVFDEIRLCGESLERQRQVAETCIGLVEDGYRHSRRFRSPVVKAMEYIDKNYRSEISVSDVAEFVYLSPDYLSRIFKEDVKINMSEYIAQRKLDYTARLLQNTKLKIYEIADMAGYGNISYFSTAFKKAYGVSPFDYRSSEHGTSGANREHEGGAALPGE